jgi:ATP-dependent DNA ligase
MDNAEVLRKQIAAGFMLATEITDTRNAMFTLPLIGQPKLNGVRARYVRSQGAFFSRDGVRYANATTAHIKVPKDLPCDLDGEFYMHGWSLQRINSAIAVNRLTPTEDTPFIEYHVFDLVSPSSASMRRDLLSRIIQPDERLKLVESTDLFSRAQAEEHFQNSLANMYEGSMYRWPASRYIAGRCQFLLKRKGWKDSEFEIVGFEEGEGRLSDTLGAFVCKAPGGGTFNVGGGIDDSDRDEFWNNRISNIGRQIKVKYLGLSDGGKPVHPQFLALL